MQHCVLDASNILVNRHPIMNTGRAKGLAAVLWIAVPQEIPGRVNKGVHGISFSSCLCFAAWAFRIDKAFRGFQGISFSSELNICRQSDRKFLFRNRDYAALLAVYNRDWSPPVPLPGYQPVAQLETHGSLSVAALFDPIVDFRQRFPVPQP